MIAPDMPTTEAEVGRVALMLVKKKLSIPNSTPSQRAVGREGRIKTLVPSPEPPEQQADLVPRRRMLRRPRAPHRWGAGWSQGTLSGASPGASAAKHAWEALTGV